MKTLHDEKRYISQKSQTEALGKLVELLDKHNKRYSVMGHRLQKSLNSVSNQVHALEEKTKVLRKEVQLSLGPSSRKEVRSMKSAITGIKSIFSKGSTKHTANLDKVHAAVKDVRQSHHAGGSAK